jgi:hypothetical protein
MRRRGRTGSKCRAPSGCAGRQRGARVRRAVPAAGAGTHACKYAHAFKTAARFARPFGIPRRRHAPPHARARAAQVFGDFGPGVAAWRADAMGSFWRTSAAVAALVIPLGRFVLDKGFQARGRSACARARRAAMQRRVAARPAAWRCAARSFAACAGQVSCARVARAAGVATATRRWPARRGPLALPRRVARSSTRLLYCPPALTRVRTHAFALPSGAGPPLAAGPVR